MSTARIQTQGSLQQTGNDLDVAIDGAGFLQVLLPDGTTAYTRDGSLQRDSQGQMVTSSGYPIQPAITIPADATSITIAKDGVVSRAGGIDGDDADRHDAGCDIHQRRRAAEHRREPVS